MIVNEILKLPVSQVNVENVKTLEGRLEEISAELEELRIEGRTVAELLEQTEDKDKVIEQEIERGL